MSLNSTPSSERIHIGIFGRRNAGKSSLINALTGQNLAIVSDIRGTTTDPVFKSMELLPLGPVVIIDTPGLDDEGSLGQLRIQKAYQVLNKTDIAVLVIDGTSGITSEDAAILTRIQEKKIPLLIAFNKSDLVSDDIQADLIHTTHQTYHIDPEHILCVNTTEHFHINELKEAIASLTPSEDSSRYIVRDLVHPGDFVVLVVPIDSAAPKGRLILPQQQTIRDLLDADTTAIVVKETDLCNTLASLGKKPSLVITDSQAFKEVAKVTPLDIPLTSFSILFARYKGNLETVVHGARALDTLEDGDTILISEGCTHHRQCDDIGTVKLPRWIKEYTRKEVHFKFTSGTEFPLNLKPYKMIIHCGGCMLNEREMKYRLKCAGDASVPITNYGTAIAYMKGILERSIEIFPQLKKSMYIRKATMKDLPDILSIYAYARDFMKKHGNPGQWRDSYPPVTLTTQDIETGCLYVCIISENGPERIGGVFFFRPGEDPDYHTIDGTWLNDRAYAVVHRVATAPDTKGVATFCLNWAYEQFPNIKIDTHDDNIPMQHLLKKLGFSCCGHTKVSTGNILLVYQKADR